MHQDFPGARDFPGLPAAARTTLLGDITARTGIGGIAGRRRKAPLPASTGQPGRRPARGIPRQPACRPGWTMGW
jgi:hypothetical protein